MIDPQKLLEQFMGSGSQGGEAGGQQGQPQNQSAGGVMDAVPDALKGFGGGVAAGGIAGLLLGSKGGRKMAKKAMKVGGMAVLGGLAYKAYSDWQSNKAGSAATAQPTPRPSADDMKNITPEAEGTAFLPSSTNERNELALKMLQAMIAAAKADGHIDADEQKRIFAELDNADLDAEAKGFLMDELRKPLDIDAIVALADNQEQAVEIYAASCMAIDPDHAAEKAYLQMLSARLDLEPDLVSGIEEKVALVSD